MVQKNTQTYTQTKTQKAQSKDLDSKMPHRLERACLKFVEAGEAMLIKLKQLLQWSSELALLARVSLPLYIGSLLNPKKRKQKQDEDEHNKHWGIGGF